MPPPEFAATGVYCTGDDCHKIKPKRERPIAEVMPPKSSVKAVWTVAGFGSGKSSRGANAPIHFGDTKTTIESPEPEAAKKNGSKANGKPGAKIPTKVAAASSAARKVKR
jgi:hypothetical protein